MICEKCHCELLLMLKPSRRHITIQKIVEVGGIRQAQVNFLLAPFLHYTMSMQKKTKAILIDIAGFGLLLAAIPIGWIPGPGGIPVVILGLSLLATNHDWADKMMQRVKDESVKASKRVSESSKTTKWLIDIASVAFIAVAVILFTEFTGSLAITSGISLVISGATLLITNQNRINRVWQKFKQKHKNK